jgi:hypothetical protein
MTAGELMEAMERIGEALAEGVNIAIYVEDGATGDLHDVAGITYRPAEGGRPELIAFEIGREVGGFGG